MPDTPEFLRRGLERVNGLVAELERIAVFGCTPGGDLMAEIRRYGDAERALWGLRRYRDNYYGVIAEGPWGDGPYLSQIWTIPPNPADQAEAEADDAACAAEWDVD